MAGRYKSQPRAKPKDERTKFDKWLEQCIAENRPVAFVMYDDEEILCLPVVIDRYMIQVNLSVEDEEEPELIWLNKGAMVKASAETEPSEANGE